MDLFGNRTQKTSQCGTNKNVANKAIFECVIDVLATSDIFIDQLITETDARQHGIYLLCVITKQK